MERFDPVLQSISIVKEMHVEWIKGLRAGEYERMWFLDGSGYGDPTYFEKSLINSAEIAKAGLFLMLFAQFEAEMNERSEALIRQHKTQGDWRDRRAWEGYDERQVRNIPFKRRLALLMNKGEAVYGDAANLYLERNDIAHGVKARLEVDIVDAVGIMSAAVAAMEENP